jgi:hypothetical protein
LNVLLRSVLAAAGMYHLLAIEFEIDAIGLRRRPKIDTRAMPGNLLFGAGFYLTMTSEQRHTAKIPSGAVSNRISSIVVLEM